MILHIEKYPFSLLFPNLEVKSLKEQILGKCIQEVAGQILMLNNDKYDIGARLHNEGSPHMLFHNGCFSR